MLRDLLSIVSLSTESPTACKILISSRDIPSISRLLANRTTLSLSEEPEAVNQAIRTYVQDQLLELRDKLDDIEVDVRTMQMIEQRIVAKSDGITSTYSSGSTFD
jgi:hypothetical protein